VIFQQEINVFEQILAASVIFTITTTGIIDQIPDRGNDGIVLATINIDKQPAPKMVNQKKTRGINIPPKKSSVLRKKRTKYSSGKIKVSGYRGQTFVYGEVKARKDGKLEGFIYHPGGNGKTYVYGEKNKNTINLYDSNGNLYQVLHEGTTSH
jgi:hypothetical protein